MNSRASSTRNAPAEPRLASGGASLSNWRATKTSRSRHAAPERRAAPVARRCAPPGFAPQARQSFARFGGQAAGQMGVTLETRAQPNRGCIGAHRRHRNARFERQSGQFGRIENQPQRVDARGFAEVWPIPLATEVGQNQDVARAQLRLGIGHTLDVMAAIRLEKEQQFARAIVDRQTLGWHQNDLLVHRQNRRSQWRNRRRGTHGEKSRIVKNYQPKPTTNIVSCVKVLGETQLPATRRGAACGALASLSRIN